MLGGPLGQGLGVVRATPPITGVLDATDAPDTATFVGMAATFGLLDVTDAQDTAVFLPEGAILGILDATEDAEDTAEFKAYAVLFGLLSAEDEPDTAIFVGTAGWATITGTLNATDAPDTAFFYEGRIYDKVPSPVPKSPWDCLRSSPPRRRVFWTTQPQACGDTRLCEHFCQIPGLQYEGDENGRTIVNTDWLQSLILNILNTRARSDLKCPTPAATFGHWSESYRDDNIYIGARFWNAADKRYIRIADAVRAINVMIESDLNKLVQMGVASKVDVQSSYAGRNQVHVVVTATSVATGSMMINLAGAFVAGGWEWR